MGSPSTSNGTAWPGLVERPARGPGDWPPSVCAVLIHGAMDRGAGMAHLARQLRDAPTLRYDRRGYGRAERLGVGGLVRQIDDLVQIVGERPTVLFGHSFGGLVALGAAATGRLDVRGVATWEVPTPWIPEWPEWKLRDPGDVADPPAEIAERFMRSTIGAARYDALPESTRLARRREGRALVADMDPLLAVGVPFDPARIETPCVFGAGDVSTAPYDQGAQWLADHVAHGHRHLVVGATHGAPMERAGEIAGLLRFVATDAEATPVDRGGPDALAV